MGVTEALSEVESEGDLGGGLHAAILETVTDGGRAVPSDRAPLAG